MNSKKIKSFIASILMFSSLMALVTPVVYGDLNKAQAMSMDAQTYGHEIFKGNISISEVTNYMGRNAVTIQIPQGLNIVEADVDNEPHDDIDEIILGNKVIIYGLRNGITYTGLTLTLEDAMDIEYKYIINPFRVGVTSGGGQGSGGIYPGGGQTPGSGIYPGGGQVPGNGQGSTNKPANTQAIMEYLEKVYLNVFNRESDQGGLIYWTAQLSQKRVSLEEFFKNLLVEEEFLKIAPTTEDKIRKLYHGIFQREPDPAGLAFWINKYNEKLQQYGSEKAALVDIIDQMTDGVEFRILIDKLGVK